MYDVITEANAICARERANRLDDEEPPAMHRCPCCKATVLWAELEPIGIQDFSAYGMASLEMRNCACGSTASREVAS